MQDFQKLTVWQTARRVAREVYLLSAHMPHDEEFGLRVQMRRASISICSNVAEGCGRRSDREFRRFLAIAMGSACELESELILAVDLEFVDEAHQARIREQVGEVKRMLIGLMRRLSEPSIAS